MQKKNVVSLLNFEMILSKKNDVDYKYSTLMSSFILESRWNLELCVDSDHFVLKLLLHLVQSCLDNLDECLDAVCRFKAATVCNLRPQTGQLMGPSITSSVKLEEKKEEKKRCLKGPNVNFILLFLFFHRNKNNLQFSKNTNFLFERK